MITIREYARPATLEEAWQLNQKRPNRVLGGMLWLKMEKISVGTAIDLSALGLDTIEETDTEFAIGAMATLRSLETHAALNAATNGAMREAVRHIVGVQFRNCATVGGSVFGRFGFSDVLTLLLALDARVVLQGAGELSLRQGGVLRPSALPGHPGPGHRSQGSGGDGLSVPAEQRHRLSRPHLRHRPPGGRVPLRHRGPAGAGQGLSG